VIAPYAPAMALVGLMESLMTAKLVAGFFLLVLCIALGPVVSDIPMAALVAVMVLVAVGTFDWHSVKPATLRRMPVGETLVTAVTDPDGGQVVYAVTARYAARGKTVEIIGLDKDSAAVHGNLTGELTGNH
jgi:MFS superfamily sulfate permease-like transporter